MSRINFGLLKANLFNKLTESLEKTDELNSSDCVKFYELVKNDPVLQVENIIYKNLLNKYISSEASASRYIEENINLFKNFDKESIFTSHDKLKIFKNKIDENFRPHNVVQLNAIHSLLFETLKFEGNEIPDVDTLHSSYEIILAHIQKPKKQLTESKLQKFKMPVKELILKNAISKFNEKYSHLNENEKALLKILINPDNKAKQDLFESLKNDTYHKLQKSLESASQAVQEKIKSSMRKIEQMQFNNETAQKDIVKLHNLNKNVSSK